MDWPKCLAKFIQRDAHDIASTIDELIDLLVEADGMLHPLEVKKTTSPSKKLTQMFKALDRSPLTPFKRGAGGVLCLADSFTALDKDNLVIPIGMI